MLAFVPPSSSFSLTRIACSDKPIALGADESKDKAKELLDWSSQLDRIDELVHTREELRAYSPPRSRFNQTDFNSRSYIPPTLSCPSHASTQRYSKVHIHRVARVSRSTVGSQQR